jgi:hypothetical protein
MNDSKESLWNATLEALALQMTQATFDTWLADTTAIRRGNTLTVIVKNGYAADWLENRLHPIISTTVTRTYGRPMALEYKVARSASSQTHQEARSKPPAPASDPAPGEIAIELVSFDPTQRGWVQVSNYAVRFWQAYLVKQEKHAWTLWVTLRSFAWRANRDAWPSIQTLADICARSNRHAILGRNAYGNRPRRVGALEVLEQERIVWVKRYGDSGTTSYRFRVLDNLPLLTPRQVKKLSGELQRAHKDFVERSQLDYEEWRQLTLPTLLDDAGSPMSSS